MDCEFDRDMLRLAYRFAESYSTDPATQNGALLIPVGGTGAGFASAANKLPDGIEPLPERSQRPLKYMAIEHAERGAIYEAAKWGCQTQGATLYVPWFACHDCARAIICAGIRKVVGHKQVVDKGLQRALTDPTWKASIEFGDTMLAEARVELVYYDGPIGDCRNLFNGEWWTP